MRGAGTGWSPPAFGGRATLTGVRTGTPSPWRRAIVPAAATTLLGLAGHVAAGGSVSLASGIAALLPLVVVFRALTTREVGLASFLAILTLGQVWVHLVAGMSSHGAHERGDSMLLMHGGATLLTAVVLRRREAAAWAQARTTALRAALGGVTLLAALRPQLGTVAHAAWLATVDLTVTASTVQRLPSRRGPPLACR